MLHFSTSRSSDIAKTGRLMIVAGPFGGNMKWVGKSLTITAPSPNCGESWALGTAVLRSELEAIYASRLFISYEINEGEAS